MSPHFTRRRLYLAGKSLTPMPAGYLLRLFSLHYASGVAAQLAASILFPAFSKHNLFLPSFSCLR